MKKSKKFNKRLLSGVTSALLSLSCLITSLSPIGASAAAVNNLDESSGVDDVTLLVGVNSDLKGNTVDETIANADNTYALGIASQFSVFLREDFHVTQSDTEGRLAVGGSIKADVDWYAIPGDGYSVGMGDYSSHTTLDKLLGGNTGYAHIVWGAGGEKPEMTEVSMRSSYDENGHEDYNTPHQIVAVESTNGTAHIRTNQNYNGYLDRFYDVSADPIIDFEDEFGKLASTSKTLAQRSSSMDFKVEKTDSQDDTVTLTYMGDSESAETVYFSLNDSQWKALEKANYVKFEKIPKLPEPRTVIDNTGGEFKWDYSYIVINSPAEKAVLADPDDSFGGNKYTSINGEFISLYHIGDTGSKNNHIGTTSVLYNFPSATSVQLGGNFQGTILAPGADVTDGAGTKDRGHLSGALIAKSFNGTTEFGFRSFTGPKGIIGGSDAYTIDIEKFDYDGKTPLGGAKIGIYKQDGTLYKSITSEEKATVTGIEPGKYYMQEISAPDGYAISSEKYYFEVIESESGTCTVEGDISGPDGESVAEAAYVGKVTITVYSGGDYLTAVASAEYEPNNVNNSAYIIDGKTCTLTESDGTVTDVKGIEADPKKFKLFKIDGKDGNYIVTYDGKLVTPTVNLTENLDTKNFSFTDEKAITFRKVDASGSPLKGAAIEMTSGTVTVGGTAERPTYSYKPGGAAEGWAWNAENSVSAIIDYGNIGELKASGKTYENVYRIHETAVPSGTSYALGDDILILKYGGNIYWTNVANGADPSTFPLTQGSGGGLAESKNSGWNRIDGNTAAEDRVLTMENLEINGADADLIKADTEGKILTGATIALYYDGEEEPIYTWENFSGSSSLIQDDGFRNIDNKHVIKGYLQPGIYYFVETAAPQGYTKLDGNLYFTVANDGSVQAGKAEAATLEMPAGYLGNDSEYEFGDGFAGKKISKVDIEFTILPGNDQGIQFKPDGDVTTCQKNLRDFTGFADGKVSMDTDGLAFGVGGRMKITYWNFSITKLTFHLEGGGKVTEKNDMFEVLNQGGEDDKKYDLKIINNGSGTTTETTTSAETTKKTTTTTTTTTKASAQTEKTTKSTSATTSADTTKKTTATTTRTTAATTVTTTTAAPVTSVKICKQDDMGSELPGAVLSLKGTDKNGDVIKFALQSLDLGEGAKSISSSGDELIWQSGSTPTYVLGIPDGEYVLTERSAPDGYEYAESITFVVENGEVTYVNGNKTSGNTVVMIDKVKTAAETTTTTTTTVTTTTTTATTAKATDTSQATTAQSVSTEKTTTTTTVLTTVSSTTPSEMCVVRICKQDSSGEEVAGATLDLRGVDKEGNEIVFADGSLSLGDGATAVRSGGTELEWVSGNSPTDVLNIPDGEYTLTEKNAPDGYEYAEQMTFVVENGKVVSVNGQPASDNTIVMIDELIITTTSETVTSTTEITTTTTTVDTPTGQRPGIVTTTSGDYGIGGGEFQNSTTTVATEVTGNVPNDGNGEFSKTTAATTPADTDSQQITTTQTVPADDTGTTTTTTTTTSTATTAASTTAVTSTTVTSTTVTGTATGSSPGTGDTSPSVLMMMLSVSLLALTVSGLMKKKKDEHPDGS